MENVMAMAVIVGIVNGVQLLAKDRVAFIYFAVALALGVGFGSFGLFGLDLQSGIIAALASSGLYKVASKMGGQ